MNIAPKFQEEYSAKIPALTLLMNLGWTYLTPTQALTARDSKLDQVVLTQILRRELAKRTFIHAGSSHAISTNAIDTLIDHITHPPLGEGLLTANERIYNHLVYGISVTEFVDGKKVNPTISLIDWADITNNDFSFTEEFSITRSGGIDTRRPDIVCFVNGIPLAVIEAKRPDGQTGKPATIDEGISQSLRNQRPDEIPHLFAYTQLLISINGTTGRYGTCYTPAKFWSAWREEDISDLAMHEIKNKKLTNAQREALFGNRPPMVADWYNDLIIHGELAVSEQDQLLISLLSPQRLLEMTRLFIIFDKKFGKIVARYQQVFGIKRLMERISRKDLMGSREGGVIWHTTGSGKSFTMVFLSKAVILNEALKQCRIIVVTDRLDLEDQLSKTFLSGGEFAGKRDKQNAMATSGKRLAEQIAKGNERIIFSLVQKFASATRMPK